jgi:hypothetical protein
LNVRSINLIFGKVSIVEPIWISMDEGAFVYVLFSFGLMVEADVGINGCFAPSWLLGTHYLNLAAWFDW